MNSLIKRSVKEESLSHAEMDWNWEEIEKAINVLENKPGVPGKDGATILMGTGAPTGVLGKVDDLYLDTSNYDVYQKTGATAWAKKGNIKGDPGVPGKDGATILMGTGAPTGVLGKVDDLYLNTSNYDVYQKTGATTWTKKGNIKGADGAKGADGKDGTDGEPGIGLGGVIQIIDVNYPAAQPPNVSTAEIDLSSNGYIYRINVVSGLNIAYVDEPNDPGSARTFEVHIVQGVTAYPVSFVFAPTWIGGDPPVLEAGLTSVVVFRIIDGNCVGNFAYTY